MNTPYGWSVSCRCDVWYTGTYCETELSNYRECNETGNSTKLNASLGIFDCECLPGWTGGLCETKLLNCSSDNCDSGGKAHGEGDWLLGLGTLCWHNFEHNRETQALRNYASIIGGLTNLVCMLGGKTLMRSQIHPSSNA